MSYNLSGIGKSLVNAGCLSAEQLERASREWYKSHESHKTDESFERAEGFATTNFVQFLVKHGFAEGTQIAQIIADDFSITNVDLAEYNFEEVAELTMQLLDEKIVRQYQVLPIAKNAQHLTLAMSDPLQLEVINTIAFSTQLRVQTVVAPADTLSEWIERIYANSNQSFHEFFAIDDVINASNAFNTNALLKTGEDKSQLEQAVDEAPVVRFIQQMLTDAIKMGASDLHFEPYENSYRVRFRIDGILQTIVSPPPNMASKITTRLKVMADMDISERRVPQDGRIKIQLKHKSVDFRMSTLPTLFGEKIVLRILDASTAMLEIDKLGLEPPQQKLLESALQQAQGMILITGPTGSGKTVSLYTGLKILNTEERNIATAEDPVEINLTGINQVNINPKVGLTFASALRSFLRQDPDIVMVGEIRDLETAETAIRASQTGHLVLSTLHTNSATETLTRLHNMGIATFNIATSVQLVIAQRLARKLCEHCKTAVNIPATSLLEMGFTQAELEASHSRLYKAVGCEHCREGYKGRVGIFEVLPIDEDIAQAIMMSGANAGGEGNNHNTFAIKQLAKEKGFINLQQAGRRKVLQGIISLEEMNRVV